MNEITKSFIEELKNREDVLGIILFGSWARGNNRPDSDVDLIVIIKDGYQRTVEYREEQAFEIIFTTEEQALVYWKSHKDDAVGLWEVAKIVYDKSNIIETLQEQVKSILAAGKNPINEDQLKQYKFDVEDQLKYIKHIMTTDPVEANYLLANKVFQLTELYFDIRQKWIPAPKQRLSVIKNMDKDYYFLLDKFYKDSVSLKEELEIARKMLFYIFK